MSKPEDMNKIRIQETKPKKRMPNVIMRKSMKMIEQEMINNGVFNDRIQVKEAKDEPYLEYDDEDHVLTFHLEANKFFNIPSYFRIPKEKMKTFSLEITTGAGTIQTVCELTGNHLVNGDKNFTYYLLDEPNVQFDSVASYKPIEFYNKWSVIDKNKKDMDHYHDFRTVFDVFVYDRGYPKSYEQDGKWYSRMEARKQEVAFTISETENTFNIDSYGYNEDLEKNKKAGPYEKYVKLKKARQSATEDTNEILRHYGLSVILYQEHPEEPIQVLISMGIAGEREYQNIKKILVGTKILSIELEIEPQSEPMKDKEIKKKKTSTTTIPGGIPMATGLPMTGISGIPMTGMPAAMPMPVRMPMGIPIGQPIIPQMPQVVPMNPIQQPVIQVIPQQRVTEQSILPGQTVSVTTTEPQTVRMEEEPSTTEQKGDLLSFLQGLQK